MGGREKPACERVLFPRWLRVHALFVKARAPGGARERRTAKDPALPCARTPLSIPPRPEPPLPAAVLDGFSRARPRSRAESRRGGSGASGCSVGRGLSLPR